MWKLAIVHSLSSAMINQIKIWEGYERDAYLDAASPPIWTIGYGHTAGVQKGWKCTPDQAEKWLIEDLKYAESVVKNHVKVEITQGMYDALVSFVFNCGAGKKGLKDGFVTLKNGNQSTMLKQLNLRNYQQTADEFPKWTRAGAARPAGLVKRRKIERDYFLKDGIKLDISALENDGLSIQVDGGLSILVDGNLSITSTQTPKPSLWSRIKSIFGVK